MLLYLKDAPYLDSTLTESMTAEMPLYNPQLSVFVYAKFTLA